MDNKLLIVTVAPKPEVKLISIGVNQILIGEEIYEEVGAGDTNGFYDFLRLPLGKIVGVRFSPFVEFSNICDSATEGSDLQIIGSSPTAAVELFWADGHDYDYALSADQFFDYNYIFKSASGRYAVTFGFAHLPENEIRSLLSCSVKSET